MISLFSDIKLITYSIQNILEIPVLFFFPIATQSNSPFQIKADLTKVLQLFLLIYPFCKVSKIAHKHFNIQPILLNCT